MTSQYSGLQAVISNFPNVIRNQEGKAISEEKYNGENTDNIQSEHAELNLKKGPLFDDQLKRNKSKTRQTVITGKES